MSVLQPWLPAQADPQVPVNENFTAVEHIAVYGKDATHTSGLTWGYLGGRWGGFAIVAGTVVLMANATSYVVVERTTGALSVSTATANWNNTAAYARVYKLTTGPATVTAVEDWRAGEGGVHGGGSGTNLLNAVNVFKRNQSVEPQVLSSAGAIAINASLSNTFGITLTGNATIANPSGLSDGMLLNIFIRQDATGGRTVSFGNKFRWAGGTAPSLSTAPNAADIIRAQYDAGTGLLFCSVLTGFDASPIPSGILPSIADDNATFNDEGDSTTGWTPTNASLATSSSWLRMTKTSSSGSGAKMSKAVTLPGANKDFIIYGKVRVRSSAANDAGVIWLYDGGSKVAGVWFNYIVNIGTPAGTIQLEGNASGSSQTAVVASGLDLQNTGVEFALQYDNKFQTLNIYFKQPDGTWDLKGRVAHAWFSAPNIEMVSVSMAPTGFWMEFDYLTICKPNIVVIGDSIAEGKNLYSPNRSLGLSDYSSTWARYFKGYPSLRNTVIVNKGVGSETSTATLARITDATSLGARVVFLHASSNDQVNGVSQAARTSNTTSMVTAITAASAKAVLLNALYGTSTLAGNPAHRDYMKSWWDANKDGVGAFSALDIMEPLQVSDFMNPAYTQSDGIHPKPAGYALIGAQLSNP
ncbi:SGNH/GDSL hydrolase family protein [Comamonas testosteroni]|uniref:SGNH/GDSL hydrolase family protein n=1 Tax=Comamonas testosteroni TaxID=285 RepID=UPI00391BD301